MSIDNKSIIRKNLSNPFFLLETNYFLQSASGYPEYKNFRGLAKSGAGGNIKAPYSGGESSFTKLKLTIEI